MTTALRDPVLRRFAVSQALLEVQFWFPVWWFFLRERGFSLGEAVAADVAFRLVVVVCEVPFGLLADRLGHRRSYLTVALLSVATFVAITFVRSWWELMAVWVAWGMLWAASSGVGSAYLYELTTQGVVRAEVGRSFGVVKAASSFASGVSLATAGALFSADPRLPFLATAVLAAVALVLILGLPSTRSRPRARPARTEVGLALRTPALRGAVIVGALVLLVGWSVTIVFQPLIIELGLGPTSSGLVYAAYAMAGIGGALAAGRLHAARPRSGLLTGYALIVVGVVATGLPLGVGAVFFLPVIGLGYQLASVLVELGINRASSTATRVTALSIVSCVGGLGVSAGRPFLGWISETRSAGEAFLVWGAIGLALTVPVALFTRRTDRPARSGA